MNKKTKDALLAADLALTDWVRQYAPEHCAKHHVKQTIKRVWDAGGTLAYIAGVRAQIKKATK